MKKFLDKMDQKFEISVKNCVRWGFLEKKIFKNFFAISDRKGPPFAKLLTLAKILAINTSFIAFKKGFDLSNTLKSASNGL